MYYICNKNKETVGLVSNKHFSHASKVNQNLSLINNVKWNHACTLTNRGRARA